MNLAQELLTNVQYSGGSRSFAKETRTLKMRSTVAGHQKVTAINWVDHWIWSYYNHIKRCQRTQHRPFCVYSAFEANWNREKAHLVGASWADQKLKKKLSFKNMVFLVLWPIFWLGHLFFWNWASGVACIFLRLILCLLIRLLLFSPNLRAVFSPCL